MSDRLLSDEEAEKIRREHRGLQGPIVHKWLEQLLDDREERVRMERERSSSAKTER